MQTSKIVFNILLAIAAIFVLPYIGGYFYYEGIFPKGFFDFPALTAPAKEPFNLIVFFIFTGIAAVLLGVVIFPKWFGAKILPLAPKKKVAKVGYPLWFWFGLVAWGMAFTVDTLHISEPKIIVNWTSIPLFWGLTLMIDGLVYVRTGGKSILSRNPHALIGIGTSSILGWLLFEYLNFYVDENWIYPNGHIISNSEFFLYAVLGASGLIPPAIEIYSLLQTFERFKNRYIACPKIKISSHLSTFILVTALASLVITPFFPEQLFAVIWYSPLIILAITLEKMDIWTPFTPLKNGDWSYVVLLSVSYLIVGVLLECFNYLSGTHVNGHLDITYSPDYWTYSIPYVDVFHVFEMPILGYVGYMPFGVYCAVWWISVSTLLNIKTNFAEDGF
jgi:hypothetical protein